MSNYENIVTKRNETLGLCKDDNIYLSYVYYKKMEQKSKHTNKY